MTDEPRVVRIGRTGTKLVQCPVRIETEDGDVFEYDRLMVSIC